MRRGSARARSPHGGRRMGAEDPRVRPAIADWAGCASGGQVPQTCSSCRQDHPVAASAAGGSQCCCPRASPGSTPALRGRPVRKPLAATPQVGRPAAQRVSRMPQHEAANYAAETADGVQRIVTLESRASKVSQGQFRPDQQLVGAVLVGAEAAAGEPNPFTMSHPARIISYAAIGRARRTTGVDPS